MAPLTPAKRNALPTKSFAGPSRSYPVNDASHARNALARVSQFGGPQLQAKVRGAVGKKFPQIDAEGLDSPVAKKKRNAQLTAFVRHNPKA